MPAKIKVGETVTFYFWTRTEEEPKGILLSCPAEVLTVHGPDNLELDAAIPEEVLEREGYVRHQTDSSRRTVKEDTIYASGSWS